MSHQIEIKAHLLVDDLLDDDQRRVMAEVVSRNIHELLLTAGAVAGFQIGSAGVTAVSTTTERKLEEAPHEVVTSTDIKLQIRGGDGVLYDTLGTLDLSQIRGLVNSGSSRKPQ